MTDYRTDRAQHYDSPAATLVALLICFGLGAWLILDRGKP